MYSKTIIKGQICYSCRNKGLCEWYQAHQNIRTPVNVDADGATRCEFYERAFYDIVPRRQGGIVLAKSHTKKREG